jgi:hypothetical protein
MTNADHIKAFRLFDQAQVKSVGKEFLLSDWENYHFQQCSECQELFRVFERQIKERLREMARNGEINNRDGWYRNLCCGLEAYVIVGYSFPDCPRHRNLPTVWKFVRDEVVTSAGKPSDPTKKDDSAA